MGLNGLWTGIMLSASLRGALMLIWYLIYERRLPLSLIHISEPTRPY